MSKSYQLVAMRPDQHKAMKKQAAKLEMNLIQLFDYYQFLSSKIKRVIYDEDIDGVAAFLRECEDKARS